MYIVGGYLQAFVSAELFSTVFDPGRIFPGREVQGNRLLTAEGVVIHPVDSSHILAVIRRDTQDADAHAGVVLQSKGDALLARTRSGKLLVRLRTGQPAARAATGEQTCKSGQAKEKVQKRLVILHPAPHGSGVRRKALE